MSHTLNSNGMDTGSNYRFGDKLLVKHPPRSRFDLSHLVNTTIRNAGVVFPITVWRTVPTDEYDISVRSLLRVLPQVVPLYSRQRLYIYAFYSRNGDLWRNWSVFMSKGMSGDVVKTIPTLSGDNVNMLFYNVGETSLRADTLGNYLGFPIGVTLNMFKAGRFSALPVMMYFRIWRDYFVNRDFFRNDLKLFPYDDGDFRLDDDGSIHSVGNPYTRFALNSDGNEPSGYNDVSHYYTFRMFCHNYPDDYFTSALPFQQRGTAPKLRLGSLSLPSLSGSVSGTGTIGAGSDLIRGEVSPVVTGSSFLATAFVNFGSSTDYSGLLLSAIGGEVSSGAVSFLEGGLTSSDVAGFNRAFSSWLRSHSVAVSGSLSIPSGSYTVQSDVTLNSLRELAISQLELERMARTDGSYAEFGLAFFGVTPKNAIDYKPVFIGGTYTSISFTEVLQTSQTTESSSLGSYGGHGIAADNKGYLGHIYCDDYGWIMILGCIMPDVYYHQGVDRQWTELYQSEMLLPDRAKLGMQPILNQELYLQEYDVVDGSGNPVNEDLWAYQDIFDDYRYLKNRISGKIADRANKSFFPYTQARDFSALPNWSKEFVEARNVRKDYLAAPIEDAYTVQFSIDVNAVRPLPYRAVPAEFIN